MIWWPYIFWLAWRERRAENSTVTQKTAPARTADIIQFDAHFRQAVRKAGRG